MMGRSPDFFIDMHSMIKGGDDALSLAYELISNPINNHLINVNEVLFRTSTCPDAISRLFGF